MPAITATSPSPIITHVARAPDRLKVDRSDLIAFFGLRDGNIGAKSIQNTRFPRLDQSSGKQLEWVPLAPPEADVSPPLRNCLHLKEPLIYRQTTSQARSASCAPCLRKRVGQENTFRTNQHNHLLQHNHNFANNPCHGHHTTQRSILTPTYRDELRMGLCQQQPRRHIRLFGFRGRGSVDASGCDR